MDFKKNLTCCVTSPICHFVALCVGVLAGIELIHTYSHYTMSTDVDSYVNSFCKKNLEKCENIVSKFN